jgi:hypothetical protein
LRIKDEKEKHDLDKEKKDRKGNVLFVKNPKDGKVSFVKDEEKCHCKPTPNIKP